MSEEEIADVMLVARIAIFTALTFVITVVFSAFIPATQGYFNFGEVGVYISAIWAGPFIGAIAGGVGSMLSDVALGYSFYAPGTLIIKGIEGWIVGWAAKKIQEFPKEKKDKWVALGVVVIISVYLLWELLWMIKGQIQLIFNFPIISVSPLKLGMKTYTLLINWKTGLYGALILTALASILGIYLASKKLYLYAPCLIGGPFMVLGYFLYESFILDFGIAVAATEIPFNIGQIVVGALLGVPVIQYLRESGLTEGHI